MIEVCQAAPEREQEKSRSDTGRRPTRLLGYRDLSRKKKIPFSRTHLLELEKAGRFPKRVKIGGYGIAWWEDEIDRWKVERAEREAAKAAKAANVARSVAAKSKKPRSSERQRPSSRNRTRKTENRVTV
jgi:prophage regulatory protein